MNTGRRAGMVGIASVVRLLEGQSFSRAALATSSHMRYRPAAVRLFAFMVCFRVRQVICDGRSV